MSRLPSLGPRGEGWVAIQVVLFVLVFAAGAAGPVVDGPLRLLLAAVGGLLVAGGGYLCLRGLRDLDTALTPLPHPRPGAELVESGSYRLVRHPIYGGIVIGAAGYALLAASPLALAGTAGLLAFFRLKSGREEAWLRARYPGYEAYAARTRRMIPRVY
jgi:protein-S-isoprenylcysteine O-methyltransferase Ste14